MSVELVVWSGVFYWSLKPQRGLLNSKPQGKGSYTRVVPLQNLSKAGMYGILDTTQSGDQLRPILVKYKWWRFVLAKKVRDTLYDRLNLKEDPHQTPSLSAKERDGVLNYCQVDEQDYFQLDRLWIF
ncbi:uncharacterized protein [Macrobrachium rosenbergii]|uniref:uncharacterized protein isoform X1 n=1 Tax=Macrobrachium rosenbergii TaxID=79674 RepID=UPI0034D465E9